MLNLWHRTSILKRQEPNIAVLSLSIAVYDLFSAVLNAHKRLTSDFERGCLLANQTHSPASDCESGAHRITRIQAARWNHSTRCTIWTFIMNGKAAWLFAYFVLKEYSKKLLTTIVLLTGSTHRILEEAISCYKYCGFLFVYCWISEQTNWEPNFETQNASMRARLASTWFVEPNFLSSKDKIPRLGVSLMDKYCGFRARSITSLHVQTGQATNKAPIFDFISKKNQIYA